jgi:hypothetical protein
MGPLDRATIDGKALAWSITQTLASPAQSAAAAQSETISDSEAADVKGTLPSPRLPD